VWVGVDGSPVEGVEDRIRRMLERHTELTEEVNRLEGVVEKQGKELEMMNHNRMGMYDEAYSHGGEAIVTQRMLDDEEEQVRALEEKIKGMQEQVFSSYDIDKIVLCRYRYCGLWTNVRLRDWMGELLLCNIVYNWRLGNRNSIIS